MLEPFVYLGEHANYELFYLPKRDSIDGIRVLHAARDIEAISSGEES